MGIVSGRDLTEDGLGIGQSIDEYSYKRTLALKNEINKLKEFIKEHGHWNWCEVYSTKLSNCDCGYTKVMEETKDNHPECLSCENGKYLTINTYCIWCERANIIKEKGK